MRFKLICDVVRCCVFDVVMRDYACCVVLSCGVVLCILGVDDCVVLLSYVVLWCVVWVGLVLFPVIRAGVAVSRRFRDVGLYCAGVPVVLLCCAHVRVMLRHAMRAMFAVLCVVCVCRHDVVVDCLRLLYIMLPCRSNDVVLC